MDAQQRETSAGQRIHRREQEKDKTNKYTENLFITCKLFGIVAARSIAVHKVSISVLGDPETQDQIRKVHRSVCAVFVLGMCKETPKLNLST